MNPENFCRRPCCYRMRNRWPRAVGELCSPCETVDCVQVFKFLPPPVLLKGEEPRVAGGR